MPARILSYTLCAPSLFQDYRDPVRVEHTVKEWVAQRVYGLALGYEDLNDQEELRRDPLLAVLVEKSGPTGEKRARERDQGKALAGERPPRRPPRFVTLCEIPNQSSENLVRNAG